MSKRPPSLTIRLQPEIRAKLEDIAKAHNRSLAAEIEYAIEQSIELDKQKRKQSEINAEVQQELAEIKTRLDRLEK